MNAFTKKNLEKQSFFQKIFKKLPKQNFIIEIENYLSEHENDISDISIDFVNELVSKYKVNYDKSFEEDKKRLFTQFLNKVLEDEKISDNESASLKALQKFLQVKDIFINKILTEKTSEIYKSKVDDVIKDGVVDDKEKEYIENIRKNLLLSDSTAKNIYNAEAQKLLTDLVNNSIKDERLSPDEEKQINELAKNLDVRITYEEKTKAALDKYKLFWIIENGEIPTISSDINLQKSENLYFKTNIEWYEMKSVTQRVNYSGVSTRIKICKGVYYKIGSVAPERVTQDIWKIVDNGTLYLTSKRIIFIGTKANKNMKLDKILAFEPYRNGVQIDKDTGKATFFSFTNNVDVFSLLLSRLMNEYSKK